MLLLKLGYQLISIKQMMTSTAKPIFEKYIGDIIHERQISTCPVKAHRKKLQSNSVNMH